VFTRAEATVTLAELVWDVRNGPAPMRLGQGFPLRAPFGAGFVAWAGDAELQKWLDAARVPSEPVMDAVRAIRSRGFVVEGQVGDGRGTDDWLSDGAADALIEKMSLRSDSLVGELEPRRLYRVSTIGAPVFGPRGDVAAFVVLFGFAGPMSGREVERLGRRVWREAERVTGQTGGRTPRVGRALSG
jgi:hypothetical protein